MSDKLTIISLGWGVQSFGLAAMSALGVLPSVDAAIHADTTHERSATYSFARKWAPWLEEHGVRVVTVRDEAAAKSIYTTNQTHLPAFTIHNETGEHGKLRRSCTQRWKIVPQRRWLSQELERRGLSKNPGVVEQWFGISLDEWERMKDSDVQYVTHRYPLYELSMARADVVEWLAANGLEIPPKSACVFCPFHDRDLWREIAVSGNGDWQHAVEVDRLIRHKREVVTSFVHPSRRPLEDIDVRNAQDHGQLELWPEECTGMCFL